MMKKNHLILGIIIFLAFLLRVWDLGNVPPSPDWDEASLGYNAYSILITGKDEYGAFLPVVLRSFDDYKPAMYTYFIIPFLFLFDLSIQAVRLPSVIAGMLTVFATYFLVKELFGKSVEIAGKTIDSTTFALVSTFLLAISPWHIQFSRIAFESNVGVALNVFSLLFFLKGLKNPKFLLLSFFLGALNLHMYQSNRVFTPLMLFIMSVIYAKKLIQIKKWYIASVVIAAFVAFPFVWYSVTNQNALLRARGVSVFSDQTQVLARNAQKLIVDRNNNDLIGLIVDNRRVEYAKSIISGYISHYDLNWLFLKGDISRHHAPNMGLLYLFELPFLFIGIYHLLFGNFKRETKLVLFLYFFLVPIPASITTGVPHAVRTLNFVAVLPIIVGLGLLSSALFISKMKYQIAKIPVKNLIFALSFLFFIFNISYYLNQYFVQQNFENSEDWQYGYKEAVAFINPIKDSYDQIIVSNERPLDQSYMFFLFYTKYDPEKYLASGGTKSGGFRESHPGFDRFTFQLIDWNKESTSGEKLFVGRPDDFPDTVHPLHTIYYLNGKKAIYIVEN